MPDNARRRAARARIEEKRAAEAAARAKTRRRQRTLVGGIVAAVVLALAVVVTVLTIDGGQVVVVGSSSAPVTVDLYEDFQCPICQQFESSTGATLARLVSAGTVQLHYHGMAFLDTDANDEYSTRALNAAAVVLTAAGPDAFQSFHDLLYANQPAEGGAGLTDAQLISYAQQAGATGTAVEQEINDLTYGDWVEQITDQASKDGVTGTPTVKVAGTQLDSSRLTPDGVTAAVQAAQAG